MIELTQVEVLVTVDQEAQIVSFATRATKSKKDLM